MWSGVEATQAVGYSRSVLCQFQTKLLHRPPVDKRNMYKQTIFSFTIISHFDVYYFRVSGHRTMAPVIHIYCETHHHPDINQSLLWFFNANSRQLPYHIYVQNSLLKLRHYTRKHYNSTKLCTTFRKCAEGKTYWTVFVFARIWFKH